MTVLVINNTEKTRKLLSWFATAKHGCMQLKFAISQKIPHIEARDYAICFHNGIAQLS